MNLYKIGLHCSNWLAEQKSKVTKKTHATYGARAKRMLKVFALICTVNTYTMPSHQASQNPTFRSLLTQWIDKANKHCDGTLNEFHFASLLTNTISNKVFIFHQTQKQDDWSQFVAAVEKEVEDHEGHGHCDLVPRSTVPSGNRPIRDIWSFKRKRFPDGCSNIHKNSVLIEGCNTGAKNTGRHICLL